MDRAAAHHRGWRRWIPLAVVVTFTLGMSLAITYEQALVAALNALVVGLNFEAALDSLPRRHRGTR